MKISQTGLDLICRFEAFVNHPYKDEGGKWTIGYGHLIKEGEKFTTVTQDQAEALLLKDALFAEKAVNQLVTIELNQDQFDACVSFVYNIGVTNFRDSTFLKLLNEGKFKEAAANMLTWDHIRHQESAGLLNRRHIESILVAGI